jgi:secreted PhoX family phosphatase
MVPFSRSRRKSVLKGVAMERREFLKMGTAAGLVSSAKMLEPVAQAEQAGSSAKPIPKRKLGKTGEELSIIGFAGIVVMENSPSFASNIVAEAVELESRCYANEQPQGRRI